MSCSSQLAVSVWWEGEPWRPPGLGAPLGVMGAWLASGQGWMDRWEATWLEVLARFDREQGWAADGYLSCITWLMGEAGMSRSTAFEKLSVARELWRRPVLAEAFRDGRISYSAARLIARCVGAEPETDEALITLAEKEGLAELRTAVRAYLGYRDQERPPADPDGVRGIRFVPRGDGFTRIEGLLTDEEAAEAELMLWRLASRDEGTEGGDQSAAADSDDPDTDGEPSEQSAAADSVEAEAAPGQSAAADSAYGEGSTEPPAPSWPARRADAFMSLVRAGAVGPWVPGADRYTLHVVVDHHGRCRLLGGDELDDATAAMLRCDCGTVRHDVGPDGEPLRMGRRSRDWNTGQRRAINIRDGGHCRWPGCEHRHVDIHHIQSWEDGGPTDIDNGMLCCRRHHRLLHHGWTVTGDANRTLTFYRPK